MPSGKGKVTDPDSNNKKSAKTTFHLNCPLRRRRRHPPKHQLVMTRLLSVIMSWHLVLLLR